MAIDYIRRPAVTPPSAPAVSPVVPSTVSLTKSAPTVTLTKRRGASGILRINLNWNARPSGVSGGGRRRQPKSIDLDLGCLYEFSDGSRGVVQALGDTFTASPAGVSEPVIRLDGDDRSGSTSGGENLSIDLAHASQIRRVLVFAYIYEGVPNWAAADGVVTLFPTFGPQVEVRLDHSGAGGRTCAIAMLEFTDGDLSVQREVKYIDGHQSALDHAYSWGMTWTAGRK
jgi:tellurite resistance protein TerA